MTESRAPWFVKICGVTTLGDANAVVEAGATSLGLIMAKSPRQLTLERALALAEATRGRIQRTVVFHDDADETILEAVDVLGVDAVQLHGPLSETLLTGLRDHDVTIVKALSIGSDEFYEFDEGLVDVIFVDGASPGSGIPHGWDELADRSFESPLIAAGGLRPESVGDLIATTSVWGVDAASGVESSPGVKDRESVRRFVEAARTAFERRMA